MKTLMITAPSSGSGKTTITVGLLRALKNRALDICAYKTGPDYIDPAFLEAACGKKTGNLDLHLQGEKGLLYSFSQANSDYCVIEGAMGYYDGVYNTYQNSSYDISKRLEIPAVLIYTPKGQMFSAIPQIKGMAEFEGSQIKGVIFNNITEHYFKLLKEAVEEYTDIKVLGYVPKMEDVELKSRHLGLVQSVELDDLEERIERFANELETNIDIPALIDVMKDVDISTEVSKIEVKRRNVTIGIAKDKAFSFYYKENLELLEQGGKIVYFSPIEDKEIPKCDLLYLGGGYPEVFKEELSSNSSMLNSVKKFAESGGIIYAECGGLMYLLAKVEGVDMTSVFLGETKLTKSLQRFGYINLELKRDSILGISGDKFTGHEFHKSVSDVKGETLFSISKAMGKRKWECGYTYKNVYAGYPHINFAGNLNLLNSLLNSAEKNAIILSENLR